MNGIFNGPETRSLINDENFEKSLNMLEMVVWHSYKELHKNVFEKNVSENWNEIVDNFIQNMKDLGSSSSTIKMHILFKHKNKYEKFLGIYSDEHGERSHKEMEQIEFATEII